MVSAFGYLKDHGMVEKLAVFTTQLRVQLQEVRRSRVKGKSDPQISTVHLLKELPCEFPVIVGKQTELPALQSTGGWVRQRP